MDPTTVTSLTSVLMMLGLSKYTAGIISFIPVAMGLIQALMMVLPVAHADSPQWYQVLFGILARVTLNLGKNAPVPLPGQTPAPSAIVPVPAALKTAAVLTLMLGAAVSLSACATFQTPTIEQTANGLIDGANVYEALPPCSATLTTLCSKPSIFPKIDAAKLALTVGLSAYESGKISLSDLLALEAALVAAK